MKKKSEYENTKFLCSVSTFQIVLTERKASLITVFSKMLKIMAKEGLKLSKVRREKSASSNFQEIFNGASTIRFCHA